MSKAAGLKCIPLLPLLLLPFTGHAEYPTRFDWTEFGNGRTIDQGDDGPCDRITTTWMIEYNVRMYYDAPTVDLSEQHIYQRCMQNLPDYQECSNADKTVCRAEFVENHGIANEVCLAAPVESGISQYDRDVVSYYDEARCINPCDTADNLLPSQRFRFRVPLKVEDAAAMGIDTNLDLKKALIEYGPLSMYFEDGPYVTGEHSILVIGWNQYDEWIFKNSSSRYFDGRAALAFDISDYAKIDVTRVTGVPECVGDSAVCDQFQRRPLDADDDGFCSIKWGDLPNGVACSGHDAHDGAPTIGPYNAYGHEATVMSDQDTMTLSSPIPDYPPFIIRAKNKIVLTPGFEGEPLSGDRDYELYLDDNL